MKMQMQMQMQMHVKHTQQLQVHMYPVCLASILAVNENKEPRKESKIK